MEHHSERSGSGATAVPAAPPPPTGLYRFVVGLCRPVVAGPFRLRASGLEHVPAAGGFVVAANHTSNLDPWPLGIALYPRQLHFMAKSELWKPGLRTVMGALGSFPVRRGEGDREAFRTAVRLCREGRVMAMFPEGTRRSKGLRKRHQPRPHSGSARIALAAGVPIVPAALRGMDRLSRFGPVHVCFGPPVPVDDLARPDSREAARVATERLWAEIQRLEAELAAEP
ncbi:MAG: 1-acyl-sn-glycerol-3-phosphate acyltransferase [Thermoleophilia bacterium]|nr:1-acyl-sn-glycerol-3-phosphate acyltransferase [Thermoleophilia bacterium]